MLYHIGWSVSILLRELHRSTDVPRPAVGSVQSDDVVVEQALVDEVAFGPVEVVALSC